MARNKKPGPFDPSQPFDAMADMFRRQTAEMAIAASGARVFKDFDGYKQIECFMAGVVTGLIGVCFAQIKPEGRDEMMKAITAYLPQARVNAEGMIDTE